MPFCVQIVYGCFQVTKQSSVIVQSWKYQLFGPFQKKCLLTPKLAHGTNLEQAWQHSRCSNLCAVVAGVAVIIGSVPICTEGLLSLPWISKAGLLADGDLNNDNAMMEHLLCAPLSALNTAL